MLNLNDREWKAFSIKDIFITEKKKKIQVPTGAYVNKNALSKGKTPRITVTSFNNGVDGYYTSTDKNYRTFNNFISVSFLGTIFYHPYKASIDMKVHCLKLINRELNKYISKFLITEIKQGISNASYGDQLSSTDMPNKLIMLPITDDGEPDYDFMEQYIKEREDKLKTKIYHFVEQYTKPYGAIPRLEDKQQSTFKVLDLFTYKRGNQNNMNSLAEGNELLISAKNINNGLKGFYKTTNPRKGLYDGNCITLNNDGDGGVGLAYYQPYHFLLDTHVYAMYPKENISKFAMLYISQALSKQRICFSHGYSISQDRLKAMTILLPITDDGSPDYWYMERYSKAVMFEKYKKYLEYAKN